VPTGTSARRNIKCTLRPGAGAERTVHWISGPALACLIVSPALGAGQPASASAPAQTAQSTIPYPASFFATMGLETAYDVVLRVPGFTLDDGSAVRGFADAAGNVLIDGQRPASKTDDLISILKRIPASRVERIDLIRGRAPGIDMQGKTIVVNVIRKSDDGFSGAVTLETYKPQGLPFDPGVRLEGTWRDGDHILEASLYAARFHTNVQASGVHDIFGANGVLQDAAHMDDTGPGYQYTGHTSYETPLLGGTFKVNLLLEDQPSAVFDAENFAIAGRMVENDHTDQQDAELGEHYQRDLVPGLSLELLGLEHIDKNSATSAFMTLSDIQNFQLDSHGGETIGRAVLHWQPLVGLTVDGGGEFAYNWLSTITSFVDNGVSIQVPAADVLVQEKRGEIFAKATWQVLNSLAIEGQVRAEQSTISSAGDVVLSRPLTFIKPRLLATWSPNADDQVRLRVEREVGQLDFNNFVANAALNGTGVVAGNPNLLPQRDWAFELAYERHFWESGVVSLTVRHLMLQDVVDRVPVFAPSGTFDEPGNIGSGTEDDLVLSVDLPLDRIGLAHAELRGLATWRLSRVTDPTTGQRRMISGQDPLDAELHFTQDFPQWNLNWGIDLIPQYYNRLFRFDEIDTDRTSTEGTVFVEYKLRPDLSLHASVDTNEVIYDATRQVFIGARNIDPLQFTDFRRHRFGPITFFKIRKTFD
jgi:hypothetical protein